MSNNWNGEWPPFIGATAKVNPKYKKSSGDVVVIGHDEELPVARYISGDNYGSYCSFVEGELTPIKSNRDKAVEEMELLMNKRGYMINPHAYAELYDLGYRKHSGE